MTGILVLWFFNGIWDSPAPDKLQEQAQTHPNATAVDTVAGQGRNPLMRFSIDQRFQSSALGTIGSASGSSVRPHPAPIQVGSLYPGLPARPTFDFTAPITPAPASTVVSPTNSSPIPSIQVSVPSKEILYLGLKVTDGEAWVSSFRTDRAKYDQVYDGYKDNQGIETNTIVVGYEARQVSNAKTALKNKGILGHRIEGISQVSHPPLKRKKRMEAGQGVTSLGGPSASNMV
ncbi:hypothetical protein FRC07_011511 [Ceratobasidium sp. 392]|nr:hypothetical protein FRC07_011511 [Ceratobasidium sp. 392]